MSLQAEPTRAARLLYAARIRTPVGVRRKIRRSLVRFVSAMPSTAVEAMRRRQDRDLAAGTPSRTTQAALRLCSYRSIPSGVDTFTPPGSPQVRFVALDSSDARRTYWLGLARGDEWTAAELDLWSRLCAKAASVLEIGANVGFYTVVGARAARGTYVAVEPHPVTADALRRNVELNGLDEVHVVEAAAVDSDEIRSVTLVTPEQDLDPTPAGAQIQSVPDGMRQPGRAQVQVDAVNVQQLVAGVDLLKLDVEGAELQLLRAMDDHLVTTAPVLMVEVLPSADDLRAHLSSLAARAGYRGWAVTRAGLRPVDVGALTAASLSDYGTWDLLLTPPGWDLEA